MMRRAAIQNAKVSAAVYVSTPGTPEEKMKSALNTAAYMGVPSVASLAPSHWMATTAAVMANMGLNSETYIKGISAARAQAEKEGKPENWPIYAVMNLGPEVMQDIMFGISTRSINENADYTPREREKAANDSDRQRILREWQEKKMEADAAERDLQARFRAGDPEARAIIGKRHDAEFTAKSIKTPGAATTVADVGIPGEVVRPAPAVSGAGGLLPARRVLNVPESIGPDNVSTDAGRVAAMIREQAKTRAPEERAIMRVFADAVEQAKTPEEYQATIQAANEELLTDRSKIPGQTAVDAVQNRPGADEINKSKLDSILTVPPTPPNQIPTVQAPSGVITKREPGAGPSLTQQPTTEVSDAIKTGKEPEGRVGEHIGTARREDIRPYSAEVRKEEGQQAGGGDRAIEGPGRPQGVDGLKKPVLPPKRAKLPVEAAKLVERVEAPAAGALPSEPTSATESKTVVIDVNVGRGKTGEAKSGEARFLTANSEELTRLRQAARDSLATVPKENWPEGKTKDEIIGDIVHQVLNRPDVAETDVSEVTLPGGITVRLRTQRAAALGVTDKTIAKEPITIAKEPAPPSGAERPELMTPEEWKRLSVIESDTKKIETLSDDELNKFTEKLAKHKAGTNEPDFIKDSQWLYNLLSDQVQVRDIASRAAKHEELSANEVLGNEYDITLPDGYVREGDRYVFKPAKPAETGVEGEKVTPYLNEQINYGGEIRSRGSIIAEMQKAGTSQKQIDAYMMGAKSVEPTPEGAGGEKAEPVVKRKIPEAKSVMKAKVEIVETKSGDVNVSVPSADKSDIKPSQQKKYLLAEIDKAVKEAPEAKDMVPDPAEAMSKRQRDNMKTEDRFNLSKDQEAVHKKNLAKFGKVTIEVPGDGTFEILNTRQSLEAFRERAKKFPLSTL
jgi:hypothetical protein